jgi:mono/diheme cytochrome c family protein
MKSNVESGSPCQLTQRIALGAAASAMTAFVLISVGLLFAAPKAMAAGEPVKPTAAPVAHRDPKITRGQYLVQIAGCNDCHTAGYAQNGGLIPMSEWLMGGPLGFRGAWGTSYPANLRLTVTGMTEDQWLQFARTPRLPPMPWFALRDMNDDDLRSIYRFIRALGPKGERAPMAAGPGQPVATPIIVFEPTIEQTLARTSAPTSK